MSPSTATDPPARSEQRAKARAAFVLGTNLVVGSAALGWALHRFGGPAFGLLQRQVSLPILLAFVSAVGIALLGLGLRWRLLLRELGEPLPLLGLTLDRAAGQSLSSLIPSGKLGGDPLRVWLLARRGVPGSRALASVGVDRTLEMGGGAGFTCVFAAVLVQQGVPALKGALVTVSAAAIGLAAGVWLTVRQLRRGRGVLTAIVQRMRLDRIGAVRNQLGTLAAAETAVTMLVEHPALVGRAFAIGIAVNVVVLIEYWLLLNAFGLPATPVAVVAAIFATGAAHSMPVPAGVGVLEGGQMWIFSMLGYPADVGLAVGLAVRLRELMWVLPGLLWLAAQPMLPARAGADAAAA